MSTIPSLRSGIKSQPDSGHGARARRRNPDRLRRCCARPIETLENRVLLAATLDPAAPLLAAAQPEPALTIKWDQPPLPAPVQDHFLGWDQYSVYGWDLIAADDWVCQTPDPVTDITWWGSAIGWDSPDFQPVAPPAFHIAIWSDVPANADQPFSHPGQVLWQTTCTDYSVQFAGWEFDPRINSYEALFRFHQALPQPEWFYQGDGQQQIFWLSIAAIYPDGDVPMHPFGWATRPYDPATAPDAAVMIFQPTIPQPGMLYAAGQPIGEPGDPWDLAFELGATKVAAPKWEQPPNPSLPGLHAHDYTELLTTHTITIADDWQCEGGLVTDLHWWGNYEIDPLGNELRGSGIEYFHLSIHSNRIVLPGGPQPGTEVWGMDVPFKALAETSTGILNKEGSVIYSYTFYLPEPFPQKEGEYYWFDISAHSVSSRNPAQWRWQEAGRTSPPILAPAVERLDTGSWKAIEWSRELYSNMAFAITSGQEEHYVKWSQPPVPFTPPNLFHGWDEPSIDGGEWIVADDWLCSTPDAVTEIHWWGSYLGWGETMPPEIQPAAFHLGIWTDVPAGAETDFSHPGRVIHELYAREYNWEFAGWEIDPRNPLARPEAVFHFWQKLPPAEGFRQEPGENIYWLSVAASYPAGVGVANPWGWTTRLRDIESPAPDDAVRVYDPTAPKFGTPFMDGEPIFWPTPAESWDTAFVLISEPLVDFGDAPEVFGAGTPAYPTTLARDGARHTIVPGLYLGNRVDPEGDGQPSVMVDGDDTDADGDDEDGVTFTSLIVSGETATVDVVASAPALLSAWLDFDMNGDWNDAHDQIFKDLPLNAGLNHLSFQVPLVFKGSMVTYWATAARFRFSTQKGLAPTGLAWDGEVEDYYAQVRPADFGDAPDPYPTLRAANGARHPNQVGPQLGDQMDAELDGRPHPGALGDDQNPAGMTDDEDGVTFTTALIPGQSAGVTVIARNVNQAARLDAWMDFNGNGNWGDPGEQIFVSHAVVEGPNALTFNVPATAMPGATFARFRISTQGGLSYTGLASDGEVEDYRLIIHELIPEAKWIQWPDLTPNGIDIRVDDLAVIADDFECSEPSLLTDVHFWGSWLHDEKGQIKNIHLSIHSDDPVGPGGSDPENRYSKPDELLWQRDFGVEQFVETLYAELPEGEWWWDPAEGLLLPAGDKRVWRYDIRIDPADAFRQTGTPEKPVIYWLDIRVETTEGRFGWKTRRWPEHFMDDAVFDVGSELPRFWKELRYPQGHPYFGLERDSIDMAFALTFTETPEEKLDFGDAPDRPYPTLLAGNGARHVIKPGLFLGKLVDDEANGQPTADALGDDHTPPGYPDDEDGVRFRSILAAGNVATVEVVASSPGILQAWFDFNSDGDWADPGEQVFIDQPLVAGSNLLSFNVPATAQPNRTYARFRFSSVRGLGYAGLAPDGEVEDYAVSIHPAIGIDYFEPSDSLATAIGIGIFGQTRTGLSIDRPGDEDWIKWECLDTGRIQVNAQFDDSLGDLDLEIYGADGTRLGQSDNGTGNEQVAIDVQAGNSYYIRAFGHDAYTLHPDYDLAVSVLSAHENYAVLFSGGSSPGYNYARYYNNTRNIYQTLVDKYGLDPDNIYVLFADGTNAAADQSSGINSDMSYATNVLSATPANLESVLTTTMKNAVDSNDHFFFWSFDHGGGTFNASGTTGEETLTGWYSSIADEDLADWLGQINAGHSTYVFTQCFAGGMLDNLLPLSSTEHGSAATNHYEYSWGDGFAAAYRTGLETYSGSHTVYRYAYEHDGYATDGEGPGGTVADHVEHPWESGSNFSIFHRNLIFIPILYYLLPFRVSPLVSQHVITFDMLNAAANASDPDGNVEGFRIESVNQGVLTKNGRPVVPGQTLVELGDSLVWTPPALPAGAAGAPAPQVDAFTIRAYDGATISNESKPVTIIFETAGMLPLAVDDHATIPEDQPQVIPVLANDAGAVPMSVIKLGVPSHGTAKLIAGQVVYTPDENFVGTDQFTYFMDDASGGTDSATVYVRVTAVNDAPEAYADEFDVNWGTAGNVLDVLSNDFDVESKPLSQYAPPYNLTVKTISGPAHGTLAINADQTYSYTPTPGYFGDDSFIYVANDGQADSNQIQVSIHVLRDPYPPVVEGTSGDDTIYVMTNNVGTFITVIDVYVNIPVGPVPTYRYPITVPSISFDTMQGNDELIVDFVNGSPIPAGGLHYDGGPQSGVPGDVLTVIGSPLVNAVYEPSGTASDSGRVVFDGRFGPETIRYTGLEPINLSHLASVTLVTPNATDVIQMNLLPGGVNRIEGSSNGIAFEQLNIQDVPLLTIDMASNDAGGGHDSLVSLAGSAPGMLLRLGAGTGANTAEFRGGTTALDTNVGVGGINLELRAIGSAVVDFNATQFLRALTIDGTAAVNLRPAGNRLIDTHALSITRGGSLDLFNNDLIVRATGATRMSVLQDVTAWIAKARNIPTTGDWNGAGLTSTTARLDKRRMTGLGVAINEKRESPVIPPIILRKEFAGQAVGINDILVKYTWQGDANIDGVVNADDYFLVDIGFLTQAGGWYFGDFNYDGVVNADDYFEIDQAFIGQTGPLAANEAEAQAQPDAGPVARPTRQVSKPGILAELFSTAPIF